MFQEIRAIWQAPLWLNPKSSSPSSQTRNWPPNSTSKAISPIPSPHSNRSSSKLAPASSPPTCQKPNVYAVDHHVISKEAGRLFLPLCSRKTVGLRSEKSLFSLPYLCPSVVCSA